MFADRIYKTLPTSIKTRSNSLMMLAFRPRMRKLFSKFISPGDLVFDVGANIGDFTDLFLALGAKVVGIEPQPYCTNILEKRFANQKNVVIVKKGVGEIEDILPFSISSKNHATSTFSEKWKKDGRYRYRNWDKTVDIKVTTLDALIEEFGVPVFCKIDVEGYEAQVLKGLSLQIPFISFEFVGEFLDDARVCARQLNLLGKTRFNYSKYNSYSLKLDKWLTFNELFSKVESEKNGFTCGDIYVRFE